MRLLIDLTPVQSSWADEAGRAVDLLAAVLERGAGNDVVMLLDEAGDPAELLRVRADLPRAITARDVLVVPLVPGDDPARQRAAREAVIASVALDAVLSVDAEVLEQEPAAVAARAWELAALRAPADSPSSRRRTLALVSPLPPTRSGVADFAAATLTHLGRHYDVTVVSDAAPHAGVPDCISRAAFRQDWWRFDRVLYHVGNNAAHAQDLELLGEAPGVVIVHDAVLSGAIRSAEGAFGHPGGTESLLAWDGPDPGLGSLDLRGTRAALAPALGILVHSGHARDLLREAGVTTTTLRVSPLPVTRRAGATRRDSRARPVVAILAHFGFVNAFKGALELVEAAGVLIRSGRPCRVAFVGEFLDRPLRSKVTKTAAALGVPLEITGFVTPAEWTRWLETTSCAVQLRQQSHGESSAALGELLVSGLPVVCTGAGSFAELPEGVVRHVPQGVTGAALAVVIGHVLDPDEGERLGAASRDFAQTALAPERWADAAAALVEQSYTADLGLRWAAAAAGLAPGPTPDLQGVRKPPDLAVWLSDTSVYAHTPFFSGIQRVTLGLHRELLGDPGSGRLLFPTTIAEEPADDPHPEIALDPLLRRVRMPLAEADWLLCLDLDVRLARIRSDVQRARARGLRVAVCVYDILPVRHPEWFPRETGPDGFAPWLHAILETADLLVVNSLATADDLRAWVVEHPPARVDRVDLALLRLGSEFSADLVPEQPELRSPAHFLMVGTVEPRKGHAEVLDAFEKLWASGSPARLTVVGRPGWMVEGLTRRMVRLDADEDRFRWSQGAADEELRALYAHCTAVLMASQGEGFGLPVIEAAAHGCPAVIRDLPVFREIAGVAATYFRADGADLVEVLERVMSASADGGLPTPSTEHIRPWSEVANRLTALLQGQTPPLDTWTPSAGWRVGGTPPPP